MQKTLFGEIIPAPADRTQESVFVERYKIHQYWARKPWNIVREYIKTYSAAQETILDPFVGSGVTAFESLALHRHAYAHDINPTSILLTETICEKQIDIKKLHTLFTAITEIDKEIRAVYATRCRNCNHRIEFINAIWEGQTLVKLYLDCPICGFKGIADPDLADLETLKTAMQLPIRDWYPQHVELPKSADVHYVDQLYTKRNLLVLANLLRNIKEKVPEENYKKIFLLMFLSTTTRTFNAIFVNEHRFSKNINPAGVWGEKRFWVPKRHMENNVLYYFKERFEKVVKAKQETNAILESVQTNLYSRIGPAQNLSHIPSSTIDYIFTDPPYADTVKYLELSTVWNAWLDNAPQKELEIVASDKKNTQSYIAELEKAVQEMMRVLKPNRYISLCFHFSNLTLWNALLTMLSKYPVVFVKAEIIHPSKKSHNQDTMENIVDTDIIITLQNAKDSPEKIPSQSNTGITISSILEQILSQIKPKTLLKTAELFDRIVISMSERIINKVNVDLDIKDFKDLTNAMLQRGYSQKIIESRDYKGDIKQHLAWIINND
jgi:16S rRNA G966 N2-methylase RsmD